MTDGTHVTARQLALALTPYAQVTDLAVNTAASGNNAAAIQSLDDKVTAELASKLDSSALAPAIAPLATAAALATTDGQVAAHGSSIATLQSSLTRSLQQAEAVQLSTAMNALATVAANYGLKTVVDQHSLDIAARITPLEVDTKVANALLGAVTAAALASVHLWCRPPRQTPAPSLLTPCSRPWTLPRRWTLKIAAALLNHGWTPPSPARRTQARWPPCSPRWTDWTRRWTRFRCSAAC